MLQIILSFIVFYFSLGTAMGLCINILLFITHKPLLSFQDSLVTILVWPIVLTKLLKYVNGDDVI